MPREKPANAALPRNTVNGGSGRGVNGYHHRVWVFGYGSLIFRPDFPFEEQRRGTVHGYTRRFFQGSPDHRGTPDDLGRVVTLVAEEDAAVVGLAYRVDARHVDDVLIALDRREQGGYARTPVRLVLEDGRAVEATTWIASPDNPWWLGHEPWPDIVARVRRARGPSGSNAEYVVRLHAALRTHGIDDPHVTALASALHDA